MIRVLLMIAVAGFFLSLVTLSTAVAIGGPDAVARGAWASGDWWDWDWDVDHHLDPPAHDSGPEITREIAWTGGDKLELDVAAEVTYTQAEGPGKLVITGPQRAVEQVEVGGDGRVAYESGGRRHGRLQIVITAPAVTRFELNGNDRLIVNGYRQDRMDVRLSGSSEMVAQGEAGVVDVEINGSGEADLSGLKARETSVDISGSGEATIAPTEAADLDISGSGEVTLLTNPPRLTSDISGSGSVKREGSAEDDEI